MAGSPRAPLGAVQSCRHPPDPRHGKQPGMGEKAPTKAPSGHRDEGARATGPSVVTERLLEESGRWGCDGNRFARHLPSGGRQLQAGLRSRLSPAFSSWDLNINLSLAKPRLQERSAGAAQCLLSGARLCLQSPCRDPVRSRGGRGTPLPCPSSGVRVTPSFPHPHTRVARRADGCGVLEKQGEPHVGLRAQFPPWAVGNRQCQGGIQLILGLLDPSTCPQRVHGAVQSSHPLLRVQGRGFGVYPEGSSHPHPPRSLGPILHPCSLACCSCRVKSADKHKHFLPCPHCCCYGSEGSDWACSDLTVDIGKGQQLHKSQGTAEHPNRSWRGDPAHVADGLMVPPLVLARK